MNFDGDFNYLGEMNMQVLNNLVDVLPELDWFANPLRQVSFNVHQNTNTIFITNTAQTKPWDGIEPLNVRVSDQRLFDIAKPIIEELEKRFDSKVARCMLIRLPAGKKIIPHPDSGHYLMSVHRCHIPVQTNPDVLFGVGSTNINMKFGQGYEINNSKWHRVENNGDEDRVHLLIDLIPNDYKYVEERGVIHPETFRPPPK